MALTKETKENITNAYKISENDTGSSAVQIALLSYRIEQLTQQHFVLHSKDEHSKHGLRKMVSLRKKHLKYLKRKQPKRYAALLQELGLRR